jgi:hypothetical protein
VTIADLFKGHFRNHIGARALKLTVTISAITFLVPRGQLQFSGLIIALGGLGWHINPAVHCAKHRLLRHNAVLPWHHGDHVLPPRQSVGDRGRNYRR